MQFFHGIYTVIKGQYSGGKIHQYSIPPKEKSDTVLRKKFSVRTPRRLVSVRSRYLKEEEMFTGIGDEMLTEERESSSIFVKF
ncbi:hypothetical protein H5410_059274 [Solanum commersonii]|uniref:Uncharacterized protein n=1 Tax=Solanum commersonii TaxID=4109 RepID=A0A9J5W2G5_SOLCO|nr:hypothetical protein H5410_059274 [Solanum commersonii]